MTDVRLINANVLKTEMADDLAATVRMSEMRKTDMAVRVLNKIDEANTIDAVPVVHGRWKTHFYSNCVDTYGNPDTCAECSECGFRWHSVREAKSWFHYCPDCGVRMDGGAEG